MYRRLEYGDSAQDVKGRDKDSRGAADLRSCPAFLSLVKWSQSCFRIAAVRTKLLIIFENNVHRRFMAVCKLESCCDILLNGHLIQFAETSHQVDVVVAVLIKA